jgi:uncharacterized protein YjbI with pentapeptide repeats
MWGFVFDVVFLGLFFSYYQHRQERRHDIKRWKEEIDDYRYWKTDEAAIRLAGLTRRLANNNATDVDLSHCEITSGVFEGLKLDQYNFYYSKLHSADFTDCSLINANFHLAELTGAHLRNVNFSGSNLRNADLSYAYLQGAKLIKTDLRDAFLNGIQMDNTTYLNLINLENAQVDSLTWIEGILHLGVKGAQEILEKYEVKETLNGFRVCLKEG